VIELRNDHKCKNIKHLPRLFSGPQEYRESYCKQTPLLLPTFPLTTRDQERQFKRLLLIQSRITERLVPQTQILILQSLATTCTFRYCIARQLEVYTAEARAKLLVNCERGREFAVD